MRYEENPRDRCGIPSPLHPEVMNTSRWASIDTAILLLRVGIGISFIVYGWQKVSGGPENWAGLGQNMSALGITFWPTFWGGAAAFTEFVGGILLILGLFTRPVLVPLIVTMIVAAIGHISGAIGGGPWHATEMLTVFVVLMMTGPGQYSADAIIARRLSSEAAA